MLIGARAERDCFYMSVEFETEAIYLYTFIINYGGRVRLCAPIIVYMRRSK